MATRSLQDLLTTNFGLLPSGYTGSRGNIGFTGSAGADGVIGVDGNVGYTGSQGIAGNVGYTGSAGADGVIGVDGNVGYTGSAGNVGYTGSAGAAGLSAWQSITANYTAVDADRLLLDTSSGQFYLTLPSTPTLGTYIQVTDAADFSVANVVVDPNGSTIEGDASLIALDIPNATYEFIFDGTTWQLTSTAGPQGVQGYTGSSGSGYTGSAGADGAAGNVGYTGSAGADGAAGNVGYTGSAGGLLPWASVTANYTAVDADRLLLDTSGGSFFLTLPAAPTLGTYIQVTDAADFSTANVVVDPNGSTIEGDASLIALDIPNATYEFIFDGTTWQLTSTAGPQGVQGYTGSAGSTGLGFNIAKQYGNVALLEADTSPTGIKIGEFALINTGNVELAENSRLYIWDGNSYTYVNDLSGAAGITGPIGYTGSIGLSGYTGSAGADGAPGNIGFTGSAGGVLPWTSVSANYTAVDADRLLLDTSSGSFYLTLPATPTLGTYIQVTDAADFSVANVIVDPNGSTIEGDASLIALDIPNATYEFIFDGNTWQATSTAGPQGQTGYTGSAGSGYTGSAGADGNVGYTGSAGADGNVGYTGSAGADGNVGYTGSAGGLLPWTSITANYTAVDADRLLLDTSGGSFYLTLPATPTLGTYIQVTDAADFSVANVVVDPNGSTIEGDASLIALDIPNATYEFIFDGTTWQATSTAGPQGQTGATGYTGSKGDTGLGFNIAKQYANVALLTADTSPTGIAVGEFALINTGNVELAENSRLYIWDGNSYTYVNDLSGAAGITGPIGYTGSAGTDGAAGNIGYTGSAGTDGAAGNIGYTGSAGGILPWTSITANYTASTLDRLLLDTSGGSFYLTLPAAPTTGYYVQVTDAADFSVANVIVDPNGSTIEGSTNFVALDIPNTTYEFIFDGTTWQLTSTAGPQGQTGYTGSAGSGYTGSAGNVGYTGSAGADGAAGNVGYTGSAGADGNVGYTGSKGDSGGILPWTSITANYTASTLDRLLLDTSSGQFYLTLPATPSLGYQVQVTDAADFSVANVIVDPNGSTIEGSTNFVALDIPNTTYEFIFDGTTWQLTSTAGPQGQTGYTGSAGSGYTGSAGNVGYTGSAGADGAAGNVGYTGSAGGVLPWTSITANYTASDNDRLLLDTSSGSFYLTLPATPSLGTYIQVTDAANFGNANVVVDPNGSTIEGVGNFVALDIPNATFEFIFDGTTWQLTSTAGPAGARGYTGSQGNVGYTGSTGSLGYTGSAGTDGILGADGYTGSQGDIGYTGSQGNVGYVGSSGYTGSAGLLNWQSITANYTASDKERLLLDTSGGSFYLTLPATPTTGYYVQVTDAANFGNANVIVDPNGSTIEGVSNFVALDIPNATFEFIFDGTTWQLTSTAGPAGARGYTGSAGTGNVGYTGSAGTDGNIGYTGSVGYTGSQGDFPTWAEQGNVTAAAGDRIFANCAATAVTVTLPASATQGDEVSIVDAESNAATNNITVARNGHNINSLAEDLVIDVDEASITLAYYNVARGWIFVNR